MATRKSSGTRYGPAVAKSVEREMKAFKAGKLKSSSGEKVTNPKQALAIALSEARAHGAKMPPPPGKPAAKKTRAKKALAKKAAAKKAAVKKAAAKSSSKE